MTSPLRRSSAQNAAPDASTANLFRRADGRPTALTRGVAASALAVNGALGVSAAVDATAGTPAAPTPSSTHAPDFGKDLLTVLKPQGPELFGASLTLPAQPFTSSPSAEPLEVGGLTITPQGTEGFSPAQRNAYALFVDVASEAGATPSDPAGLPRAARLEVVEHLAAVARPPSPPAAAHADPDYPGLVARARSSTVALDQGASERLARDFAGRGLSLGDAELTEFARLRGLPASGGGMTPALADAVVEAARGGERLVSLSHPLSPEGKVALAALGAMPHAEVLSLRRELAVPAPAAALNLQERVGGSTVIEQRLVDAFVGRLTKMGRHVTPGSLAAFQKANRLPATGQMSLKTAHALVKASRTPVAKPKPPAPKVKVVDAYVNGVHKKIKVSRLYGDFWLRADAAAAFRSMSAAAAKHGVPLRLNSAFRTMSSQRRLYHLYKAGKGNLAALPGFSNHQGALAVDIRQTPGVQAWLRAHARHFGFYRTVPSENWHFVFKGR